MSSTTEPTQLLDEHSCVGQKSAAIFSLRAKEFARLDRDGHTYLDYTGGMVYPESLVKAHAELLIHNTYGNPHSNNPTSLAATALCDKARADVLSFFNASPDEYVCIFTSNASGALRIVGESFPFTTNGQYLLLMDNHNSVNGIREFARARGATVSYAKTTSKLRIDDDLLESMLQKGENTSTPKLFAFPAQSNFSGVKHSLEWIERAQQRGWYVLLDAAAYVPTSPLDLSVHKPDFVAMSFYKIFGYPTGIGALLMRKKMFGVMQRPWFAGGTIKFVSTTSSDHVLATDHEAFEDGTINYLGLPAVSLGLAFMKQLGMNHVCSHIQGLTRDLINGLQTLRHTSGAKIVRILGPNSGYRRGGTVTIDVFGEDGVIIQPGLVERLANLARISIRSGCFCNPGDSEMLFPEAWKDIRQILTNTGDVLKAREQGLNVAAAVRISIGIATSEGDISNLLAFLSQFKDRVTKDVEEMEAAGYATGKLVTSATPCTYNQPRSNL